jgi:hypothetical protein
MIQTIVDTAFVPLTNRLGADSIASGQEASRLVGAGNLGANDRSGSGIGVKL